MERCSRSTRVVSCISIRKSCACRSRCRRRLKSSICGTACPASRDSPGNTCCSSTRSDRRSADGRDRTQGGPPEIDSAVVWAKLIERLQRNEYTWDESLLGGIDSLAVKVAYFFHAMLQGTEAFEGCAQTLAQLPQIGIRQGILDDCQQFTLAQLVRAMRRQGGEGNLAALFSPEVSGLSYQLEVRKPSPTLFETVASRCAASGFEPEQVLYLTNRLTDDLGAAKQVGFRTGLMVVDESCTQIEAADLKNPEFRPDRLLTDLRQVLDIVGG